MAHMPAGPITRLSRRDEPDAVYAPAWLPSSRGITFAAIDPFPTQHESHILVMRDDGSELADLAFGYDPQWEP